MAERPRTPNRKNYKYDQHNEYNENRMISLTFDLQLHGKINLITSYRNLKSNLNKFGMSGYVARNIKSALSSNRSSGYISKRYLYYGESGKDFNTIKQIHFKVHK